MKILPIVIVAACIAAAATLAAIFLAAGGEPRNADTGDAGLVALGQAVYQQRCASCHGTYLEGQANWKERLPNGRLPAPPHDATGHTWHHSDRQLFEIVKRGVSGIVPGYESDMPVFAGVLGDREIWAVIAFLKSTWPPRERAAQERLNRRSDGSAAP